jgi:hypothetical protein
MRGQALLMSLDYSRQAVGHGMKLAPAARLKTFVMAGLAILPIIAVFAASLYVPVYGKFFAGVSDYPVRVPLSELPPIWPRPAGDVSARILLNQLDAPVGEPALAQPLPAPTGLLVGIQAAAVSPAATGDAPSPLTSPSSRDPGNLAAGGIMPVNFDIAGPADFDATLQVEKTVTFNDRPLGQLTVRIDEGARVYVSTAEMSEMFPEGLRPPGSWQEFVSLRQVRDAGIDLRYDPMADLLVLRDAR